MRSTKQTQHYFNSTRTVQHNTSCLRTSMATNANLLWCTVVAAMLVASSAPITANKCITTKMVDEQRFRTVYVAKVEYYWGKCARMGGLYYKTCQKTRTVRRPQQEPFTVQVATQVEECCRGYVEDFRGDCMPDCTDVSSCTHGVCVAPNQCECDDGYEWEDKCTPTCDHCEHGTCTEPNVCACSVGYEWDGSNCAPVCSNGCTNGVCIQPDVCSCIGGFILTFADNCVPYCEPRCDTNGHCAAPNQCECSDGYRLVVGSATDCQPICEPGCTNAVCIAPNQCECHPGYRLADGSATDCQPICEPACTNAVCIGPNECACETRFAATLEWHNCSAVCDPPCDANGHCAAPNQCQCADGYRLADGSVTKCQPICEPACKNGECIKPNQCQCNQRFVPTNEWHTCSAVCNPPCNENGHCVAPDQCHCSVGYRLADNSTTDCQPICEPACMNGECIKPNQCQCDQRFAPTNDWHTCSAVCNPPCDANGHCAAPDQCHCSVGYRLADHSTTDCQPICEQDCTNAACVGPNQCECHDAHEFEHMSTVRCRPRCEPACEHGECIAPDRCECDKGYLRAPNATEHWRACVAQCGEGACANGYCVAPPDQCACNVGYALHAGGNGTVCEPVCEPACGVGGFCEVPHQCACAPGYERIGPNECLLRNTPSTRTTSMQSSSETTTETSTELHSTSTARAAIDMRRMPCVPFCSDRKLAADDVCVHCSNQLVVDELINTSATCVLISGSQPTHIHVPIDDSTVPIAQQQPEMCQCRKADAAIAATTEAYCVYGRRLSCSVTGCVGGVCEHISGVCVCHEGYEADQHTEDGADAYRCVPARGGSMDEWSNKEHRKNSTDSESVMPILMFVGIGLIVVAALASVAYIVYYRKRAYYPRDTFMEESSSI